MSSPWWTWSGSQVKISHCILYAVHGYRRQALNTAPACKRAVKHVNPTSDAVGPQAWETGVALCPWVGTVTGGNPRCCLPPPSQMRTRSRTAAGSTWATAACSRCPSPRCTPPRPTSCSTRGSPSASGERREDLPVLPGTGCGAPAASRSLQLPAVTSAPGFAIRPRFTRFIEINGERGGGWEVYGSCQANRNSMEQYDRNPERFPRYAYFGGGGRGVVLSFLGLNMSG